MIELQTGELLICFLEKAPSLVSIDSVYNLFLFL